MSVVEGQEPQGLDLGHGHTLNWNCWAPDLTLNPQWAHLADRLPVEHFMASIDHTAADGSPCVSAVTLDGEVARAVGTPDRALWQVESMDPLTLSASVLCGRCGDHGFVRGGRWVPA